MLLLFNFEMEFPRLSLDLALQPSSSCNPSSASQAAGMEGLHHQALLDMHVVFSAAVFSVEVLSSDVGPWVDGWVDPGSAVQPQLFLRCLG